MTEAPPRRASDGAEGPAPLATHEKILVVDFGAQYTQLIARRVREHRCFAEIVPPNVSPERVKAAKGVIL